jgi:hypothetical protein
VSAVSENKNHPELQKFINACGASAPVISILNYALSQEEAVAR